MRLSLKTEPEALSPGLTTPPRSVRSRSVRSVATGTREQRRNSWWDGSAARRSDVAGTTCRHQLACCSYSRSCAWRA